MGVPNTGQKSPNASFFESHASRGVRSVSQLPLCSCLPSQQTGIHFHICREHCEVPELNVIARVISAGTRLCNSCLHLENSRRLWLSQPPRFVSGKVVRTNSSWIPGTVECFFLPGFGHFQRRPWAVEKLAPNSGTQCKQTSLFKPHEETGCSHRWPSPRWRFESKWPKQTTSEQLSCRCAE